MPANLENSAVVTGLEKVSFHSNPKEEQCQKCSNCHPTALISHTSTVMLEILQARPQQYVNRELTDEQAGFRKGRGTRDQTANIHRIIEKARKFQKTRDRRNTNTRETPQVVQWLGVWLPTDRVQGTQVQSLIRELRPRVPRGGWAHTPRLLSPPALEPQGHSQREARTPGRAHESWHSQNQINKMFVNKNLRNENKNVTWLSSWQDIYQ